LLLEKLLQDTVRWGLHVTGPSRPSHVTRHMSHVTPHTPHNSHLTPHTSHLTHLTGYTEHPTHVSVHLSDGSSCEAACLVAADGIWSSVARQKLQHTSSIWMRPGSSSSSSSSSGGGGGGGGTGGMRYLGVMIVLGICESRDLLSCPVTDGKTIFQTLDGRLGVNDV
jgi:hypothetical protein